MTQFDIGSVINDFQRSQRQANRANQARLRQLIGDLNPAGQQEEGGAPGLVGAFGNRARDQLARSSQNLQGSLEQDLISRGLGNSTILSSVRRGVERDRLEGQRDIDERVARQRAGILGSVNQQGPDPGQIASLVQRAAESDTEKRVAKIGGSPTPAFGGGSFFNDPRAVSTTPVSTTPVSTTPVGAGGGSGGGGATGFGAAFGGGGGAGGGGSNRARIVAQGQRPSQSGSLSGLARGAAQGTLPGFSARDAVAGRRAQRDEDRGPSDKELAELAGDAGAVVPDFTHQEMVDRARRANSFLANFGQGGGGRKGFEKRFGISPGEFLQQAGL